MKRFLTSALWTWVIILLALLCLLAGNQQIHTVQDHQERLEQCTTLARAFNHLEEDLWNLEAVMLVRKADTSVEVQQRMMQDLVRLKKAVESAKTLPAMHTETQGSLIRLETVLILLERNLSIESTNLEEADSNLRRALQEVRSASTRLWQQYRDIAVEITNRWQEVNLLVLASCLLAAFLAFLLRAYHRDLMDRKEAERALRESEDRYRRLVEVSPDAILVHREGKILFVNSTGAAMFGAPSAKSMLGADLSSLAAEGAESLGLFRTANADAHPSHHRMIRLDQSVIDVEVVSTEFAYQDHPAVQMVIRDITEIKKKTEALAASEERFRSLFENVSEGVYRSTAEGRILDANPALVSMLGYESIEEFRETSIERDLYVDPADRIEAIQTLHREGVLRNFELRLRHKDNSIITILENARVVKGPDGEVEFYEGTLTNITHMKHVEDALVEARDQALHVSRLKSEFLANMSHEIRTPMNGIIGMAELLGETSLTSEQREYSDAVNRSAHFLMNIINDVLDFSKIEAGRVELEQIEFNLRHSVEDVMELLAEQAQEKNLDFAASFDADLPESLSGDPYRIQQVITNLAGNAIKFTASGEVVLRVHCHRKQANECDIEIEVLDTGIGISPDLKSRLFQPFTQGDGSTTRRFGGTGLGLAISRQLVEMMGGSIGAELRSGGGSRFWFRIPLSVVAERPDISLTRMDSNRPRRALLGLLRRELAQSTAAVLQRFGVESVFATTGQELLLLAGDAQSQKEPFGLILVQDDLPDMDSLALATHLQEAGIDVQTSLARFVRIRNRSVQRENDHRFAATISEPYREQTLIESAERIFNGSAVDSDIMELSKRLIQEAITRPLSAGRVLLAEDNAINQRVAIRMLEKLGLQADLAENGAKAVEALKQTAYPLVLMDCQMPEMDGFQATAAIRDWEAREGILRTPILAMTAHALPGDRERCLDAGMDDYISKPISLASLDAVLSRWMDIHKTDSTEARQLTEAAGT
jgi:PAS domain S-box-containing protein